MIDFRKLYNTYDREDLINTCVNLKHNKERLSKEVNKSYIVCGEKDKEIERLNNIIKPQENNYNFIKLLFENKSKEEVIKAYTYKCEQLDNLYNSYNKKEIEIRKKDNIINEIYTFLSQYTITHTWQKVVIEDTIKYIDELKGVDKE